MKVIFIHGNGGGTVGDHWFPYLKKELTTVGLEIISKNFPDPEIAREKYWLPFLEKLGADEDTILIGHSSGAIAAMRFAETHKILGSVLVGTYYTDLNDKQEKQSGYFNRPWDWQAIKQNQKWTAIFASIDDPWISIEEPRFIRDQLGSEYFEYTNEGHFGMPNPKPEFPEIVSLIKRKLV